MIGICICDDNRVHLENSKRMIVEVLGSLNIKHNVLCFADPGELMLQLNSTVETTDIVFLDIRLQNTSGIEIGKRIKETHPNIKIIFMTSHISYAMDIFDASPTYFLLKPISRHKLTNALESAIKSINESKEDIILINHKGKLLSLRISRIDYIMSSGRVITFFGENQKTETYSKMDFIETMLNPMFLRCHQSYMVNMKRIRSFDKLNIELYSGVSIPVSKSRYSQAKSDFLKYLGGRLCL